MNWIRTISVGALFIMIILSFSGLAGYHLAGLSVIIGIVLFVILRKRGSSSNETLSLHVMVTSLKKRSILMWIILPLMMNVICFTIAIVLLPEFIEHLQSRTGFQVSLNTIILLVLQLFILALGEEIAWRGFFQEQLSKRFSLLPSIIFTSIIFSIGHFTVGDLRVVSYDLIFIFINSILYGYLYAKTNNVWISAISHFIANLFSIIFIALY